MQSPYDVPIVPLNLRKEETIVQIAEVVQYLSEVVDDVLSRVNRRIEQNNSKLNDITARINVANEKVSQLTGAKKATQVFSSSKYPAANVNRRYDSVFATGDPLVITRNSVKCSSVAPSEEKLETLQFYHVNIKQPRAKAKTDGLGKTPSDVVSLNEILLYNTGKNVYSKYELSDSLSVSQRWQVVEDKESVDDIGAAPLSISDRSAYNKVTVKSFSYTPNLGDVPTIDVPLDLPDLPGIADDLRYTTHSDTTIAPSSVTTTPNIPDLPLLVDLPPVTDEIPKEQPPPPPPPPIETPQKEEVVNIPPPPELVITAEESRPTQIAPADQTDMHASLMEAIRRAGGSKNAKLKATADERKAEETKAAPKGDLMADLHAKLAMRRKGISGTKTDAGGSGGSALDKVSAMIPPPPSDSSTNTEDEDWDE